MAEYQFKQQLALGEQAEQHLDAHFGVRFCILPASTAQQRQGIDRIFIDRHDSERVLWVEYKTDFLAHRTGNVFIETVSVDTAHKAGWVHTTQADYVLYYIPGLNADVVYVLRPPELRKRLDGWTAKYPQREARNAGYSTWGLLVPQDELERCAAQVISNIAPLGTECGHE